MALLETRNATKRFGGLTAVNDLTFPGWACRGPTRTSASSAA